MTPKQALLVALLATLIFSSAPSSIRAVQLDTISLGIVRLGLASLAMTLVLIFQRKLTLNELRKWSAHTWMVMLLVGLAFGIHWVLFFISIKISSAAIGTIGFSTYGLQLLVLGWMLGLSRVTRLDVAGLFLAMLGTILLAPEFSWGNRQTQGLAIGVLSGFFAACLPLLHQKHAQVDVQLRTWGQFTIALLVFLCLWPYATWNFQTSDIPLLLYLGLVIAWFGHSLWIRISTILSTTTLSILTYLYLPLSLTVSFLTLGEKLSPRMLAGTLLVLIANALVLWSQTKNRSLGTCLGESA